MLIPLKLVRDQPLQQQLYDQLRELITDGRLQPGTRMPSTRMLADQFAVSRITVLLTYERLIADGHLETIPAKGTFVGQSLALPATRGKCPVPHGQGMAALPCRGGMGETRIGRPDPTLFPIARWRGLLRNAVSRVGTGSATTHATGVVQLRQAVARWLSASRGLAVSPEQIILVSGRQQALHIISRLLLCSGARAVVEEPCDDRTACTYVEAGAELIGVPVDAGGLRPELLPTGHAALLHVTPEHQRPLGVLLAADRRRAVLDWAAQADAMVVAEDCDGEFRYGGMEAPPLTNLDRDGRVIHVGCFATALGPWVTTGYLAVPTAMVQSAREAQRLIDDSAGSLECGALAEFLDSGAYARHVHRLRKTYMSRRAALLTALRRHFGAAPADAAGAGLHLAWRIPDHLGDAAEVAEHARACGLEADTTGLPEHRHLLLGFGTLDETRLEAGVAQLAATHHAWRRTSLAAGRIVQLAARDQAGATNRRGPLTQINAYNAMRGMNVGRSGATGDD